MKRACYVVVLFVLAAGTALAWHNLKGDEQGDEYGMLRVAGRVEMRPEGALLLLRLHNDGSRNVYAWEVTRPWFSMNEQYMVVTNGFNPVRVSRGGVPMGQPVNPWIVVRPGESIEDSVPLGILKPGAYSLVGLAPYRLALEQETRKLVDMTLPVPLVRFVVDDKPADTQPVERK